MGVFDYGEFFPESKHAKATSAGLTLSQACENYLEACGGLASKTKRQYRNALAVWQRILGEGRPLVSIKHSEIARAVGTQFRSAKLANNYLIPLRGAFEMASRDLKFASPLDGVKNRKHQAPQPDPLTPAEVEKVLAHMEKHEDEGVVRYFRFMFSTGLRPEEAIALQWRDVDWQALTIRVERALSDGGDRSDQDLQRQGRRPE